MTSFSIFMFVDSPHTHGRWVRSQYMWVEEGLKTIHCCGWTMIILDVGMEFNQVLFKCSKLHSQVCQPNPFVNLVALERFKGWDCLADSGNLVYMSIRVSKDATSLKKPNNPVQNRETLQFSFMWSWVTWVLYWSGLCVCCWCLVLQAVMNELAKLWGSLSRVCSEVPQFAA
jgi:hypothetical protein